MKSKVELNSNGINYLSKGETPEVLNRGALKTVLQTKRGDKVQTFEVSNELMKLWIILKTSEMMK